MNIEIIKKYNKPGPRYTSYPPATFFTPDFALNDFKKSLITSNNQYPREISLYIHVPFCPNLCHFCGCNTTLFESEDIVRLYFDAVIKEIKQIALYINHDREVTQIHWGGGTPNSVSFDYIDEVMQLINKTFEVSMFAEIAMECNPAYLEFEDVDRLKAMGFNRISIGIQDFDEEILNIVNRKSPKHPIADMVKHIRKVGFKGVNLDLIYGLPRQTPESFANSVKKAIDISPDRLVTFSYAHVPWVKNAQKNLEVYGLPSAEQKLLMFDGAYKLLIDSGYVSIGMDHYAKPDDELAKSLKYKRLHRNFQGYCSRETTGQVYGFGSTAISQLGAAYIQNTKDVKTYINRINETGFALERGYELTSEDIIRRKVINEIMCNGYLDFKEVASSFKITIDKVKQITAYNPEKLQLFIIDNLLTIKDDIIQISETGMLVVRNIAMAFDPLLKESKAQFSKTI